MSDPLLSLIAAKVKAVGLVAGTALVTTALVGGGAVAMTTVSDDRELPAQTSVTQSALVVAAAESDTKTVGIHPKEPKATKAPKPRVPTVAVTCTAAKNHGEYVSSRAKSLPKGSGRGEQVSAAAKSDCGKKSDAARAAAKAAKTAEQAAKKAARKAAAEAKKAARATS